MSKSWKYIVSMVLLAVGLTVLWRYSKLNEKVDVTRSTCGKVYRVYNGDFMKGKEIGFVDGDEVLMAHLVLVEQDYDQLYAWRAINRATQAVVDQWGNGIVVMKTANGYLVKSKGPDGVWDTSDDIVIR